MKILGFYIGGHDSNYTIYDTDTNQIVYTKTERVTGAKHHKCLFNDLPSDDIDVIVYSDGNRNHLGKLHPDKLHSMIPLDSSIGEMFLKKYPNLKEIFYVDHHFCHTLSVWPLHKTKDHDYGIVLDGRGDQEDRVSVFSKPYDIVHDNGDHSKYITFKSGNLNAPAILRNIGRLMKLPGNGLDLPGKIMGANAYGNVDHDYVNNFIESLEKIGFIEYFSNDQNDFISVLALDEFTPYNLDNKEFVEKLSTVHYLVGKIIVRLFEVLEIPKTALITYSGGVAQNTVWNEMIQKKYKNILIPPHCYDGGMSLGAIEFYRIKNNHVPIECPEFPYIQRDEIKDIPATDTIKQIAKYLADGKIVAWMQGKGEIGPRALGNRSILMNPAIPNGKDIINARVKHREYWRPFAPSILLEHAKEWFDFDKDELPYMLYAVQANKLHANKIPAVIHGDNTARVQTVSENNKSFYELINEFYKLTDIPLLLNTSLNAGGSPIFAYKEQAVDFFNNVDIDVLCIGNEIYLK